MRHWWACALVLAAASAHAATLRLVPTASDAKAAATLAPLKPFEVDLVAERDSTFTEMSAVAYTLQVPDGVLVVGEQLLVESLLGLGTSRTGINFVFKCTDRSPLHVLRFRFVATHRLDRAVIKLRPEPKTKFLGLVSCKTQNFSQAACAQDSLVIQAR